MMSEIEVNAVLTHTAYGLVREDDDYVPLDGEIVLRRNHDRAYIGDGQTRLADLPDLHPQMFVIKLAGSGPLIFRERNDGQLAMVLMNIRNPVHLDPEPIYRGD